MGLKQKVGLDPSTLANPDKLEKKQLAELVNHFGHLAELDQQVAVETIRYLVDGGDETVLLQLGGLKGAAEELCIAGATKANQWELSRARLAERARFYEDSINARPNFWVRFGHVLDAIWPSAQKKSAPKGWPSWFVALLVDLDNAWCGRTGKTLWPVELLEAIAKDAKLPTELLARGFLYQDTTHSLKSFGLSYCVAGRGISGWGPYLSQHLTTVREALATPDADVRLHAIRSLANCEFKFAPVVDLLVELATGPQKTVRDAAWPHLHPHRDLAVPHLDKVLTEGDAAARHEAVQLLWRLLGRDAIDRLKQHAETEGSERVRQTIEKFLSAPEEQPTETLKELAATLPPLQLELGEVDLPETARAGIRQAVDKAYQQVVQNVERAMEVYNASDQKRRAKPEKPANMSEKDVAELLRFVEGKSKGPLEVPYWMRGWMSKEIVAADWFAPPGLKLIHVVRLLCALFELRIHEGDRGLWWYQTRGVELYRSRGSEAFGLRELDAVVATLPNAKPGMIAAHYLATNLRYSTFFGDWPGEAVWPVFVEHPEPLDTALGPPVQGDYRWSDKRQTAFKVLAMFPQLPPGYIPLLWDIALGESKSDRPLAQAALASVPDKASKVIVALKDGRQQVRAAAAEWLGKIGDPSAIEPLKAAFRAEKQEMVKGAYMAALDALGADVNEFLDRKALLKEAKAALAKKLPRGAEWIPFDRLPPLHWEDTKELVAPEILRWWIVQGIQQKMPVAGPLLRRYLSMCRKHEATALAKFILSAWIAQDTRTPSHDEAMEKARAQADKQWPQYSKHQYYLDHYKNDKENLVKTLYQNFSTQFLGSAIGEKGMLALVTEAGDADCVKQCESYIRKYFGSRLAQSKALVEILGWIKHPLAIQALLGFSTRFRTKAIRQLAEQHVKALAEREGWTIDELADRTLPDAGFERPKDADGQPVGDRATLVLDYGPRKFTVVLDDELEPIITTEEGKKVKAPPSPGKNDDVELAKAAKKSFSDAKKVVKEVVKRQTERFYEAVCTQRTWKFEEWKRFLADHPIVSRLCVRLAWLAAAPAQGDQPERFLGCFRPLEDGSLTNEQDEEVKLPPETLVRLAHTCNTPPELGAAWQQHFKDYDVKPPFEQFGRPTYALPEERKKETDILDFQGHMLTTFKLRGKANKLGYLRGEGEDGGVFHLYRKPFPSLSLQAVIEFSGSMLPEEDVAAALHEMYFIPIKNDKEAAYSWQPNKLPLGKVPPVLLSECYNDVKQMAAEGSGFDPEWQKRSYF
jgi:hypothetical protein